MNKLVKVWQIGRLSYRKSLELQKHLVRLHHENKELSNTLVCLEHPPVYTTGIRTGQYPEQVAKNLEQLGKQPLRRHHKSWNRHLQGQSSTGRTGAVWSHFTGRDSWLYTRYWTWKILSLAWGGMCVISKKLWYDYAIS